MESARTLLVHRLYYEVIVDAGRGDTPIEGGEGGKNVFQSWHDNAHLLSRTVSTSLTISYHFLDHFHTIWVYIIPLGPIVSLWDDGFSEPLRSLLLFWLKNGLAAMWQ